MMAYATHWHCNGNFIIDLHIHNNILNLAQMDVGLVLKKHLMFINMSQLFQKLLKRTINPNDCTAILDKYNFKMTSK